ncbi:MAG: hypothetical protein ABSF17_08170 [Terracidiphilus sp.]|jgi:hypothetical protein
MYYECRHIMPNGSKCRAPALTGKPYCYFHTHVHRLTSKPPIQPEEPLRLPVLEDHTAIQFAITQVLDALSSARLDPRRAGLFLFGIQIASRAMHRTYVPIPDHTVETVTQSESGDELAPEERICDVPEDCVECSDKDICSDYESMTE